MLLENYNFQSQQSVSIRAGQAGAEVHGLGFNPIKVSLWLRDFYFDPLFDQALNWHRIKCTK